MLTIPVLIPDNVAESSGRLTGSQVAGRFPWVSRRDLTPSGLIAPLDSPVCRGSAGYPAA